MYDTREYTQQYEHDHTLGQMCEGFFSPNTRQGNNKVRNLEGSPKTQVVSKWIVQVTCLQKETTERYSTERKH